EDGDVSAAGLRGAGDLPAGYMEIDGVDVQLSGRAGGGCLHGDVPVVDDVQVFRVNVDGSSDPVVAGDKFLCRLGADLTTRAAERDGIGVDADVARHPV